MLLIGIVMIYPLWHVIMYSFSSSGEVGGGLLLFPRGFTLDAYKASFQNKEIMSGLLISVLRAVIGPAAMLVISSMAAYALSKNELIGIKFFRKFFLFSMYISAGLLPTYILIRNVGLTNNFWVYIIPAMANVFNIILIRAYIEGLPPSLEESAKMDGAGPVRSFFAIVFPLCVPILAAVVLYACVGQWNAYMDAQLYNFRNRELYPLQYILFNYMTASAPSKEAMSVQQKAVTTTQTLKMAITVISTVPILFVYPFLRKYFASGLLVGAVKA
jgi:putative aldouronate transport system permease protein